jgi:hypothetical protein
MNFQGSPRSMIGREVIVTATSTAGIVFDSNVKESNMDEYGAIVEFPDGTRKLYPYSQIEFSKEIEARISQVQLRVCPTTGLQYIRFGNKVFVEREPLAKPGGMCYNGDSDYMARVGYGNGDSYHELKD